MSNNFDKIVKLACKPKNAPPKAKYVDVLVSATYSDDGSLNDITRALALRLREPNAVIVFKALLTLHQMIRSGSTDTLLEHLSQSDVLRLRNVSGQNWEGYSPPSNMGAYAQYLDTRIRVFRDIKHDLVRVQTESNRRSDGLGAGSKARRLRHLPVEKGLLREVKTIQRILDSLVQCRFFEDDMRDENTVLAFRMLIKDLLVLFQAGNEGVCNILEHYFEMSKVDANESFEIYKSFIKQTDRVVDYLGVVRKLHNVLNVPVPNLKHAPTSLVKALEEYLHDPNFENNRLEYKRSLGVVEGKPAQQGREPSPSKPAASESKAAAPIASSSSSAPAQSSAPSAPPGSSQKIQDFFDSIQADHQPTMFGGAPSGGFQQAQMQQHMQQQQQQQQQPVFNPFRQSMMMPQQTGFMGPQITGFPMQQQQPFNVGVGGMQPQMTGMEFLQPQQTGAMAFGNRTSMFQPQATGFTQPQPQQPSTAGFLQPQTTGSNPFRQSMMLNTTGLPSGLPNANQSNNHSGAFSQPSSPFGQAPSSFANQIQRPGSTPALSVTANQGQQTKPLVAQSTGSKNPFAPPGGVPKPKVEEKKAPTMAELAAGRLHAQMTGFPTSPGGFGGANVANGANANGGTSLWANGGSINGAGTGAGAGSGMSDIASGFTLDGTKSGGSGSGSDFLAQFGSMSMSPSATGTTGTGTGTGTGTSAFGSLSGLSTNPTGFSSAPTSPTGSAPAGGFLQPQRTGYGGSNVKPFKPTSSFGSQLMETLPPIPEPSPEVSSPGAGVGGGVQSQQTGFPGFNPNAGSTGTGAGTLNGQPTGLAGLGGMGGMGGMGSMSSLGSMGPNATGSGAGGGGIGQFGQLSPQLAGAPNPFRQSMFGGGMMGGSMAGQGAGAGAGAGAFGPGSPFAGQNSQQQQQGAAQGFGGMGMGMGMFGQGAGQQQQQHQQASGSLI